tara:strand:+ start:5372 stop:6064 length:693 start_codon:yes stop_codon:yes gene_type:complete
MHNDNIMVDNKEDVTIEPKYHSGLHGPKPECHSVITEPLIANSEAGFHLDMKKITQCFPYGKKYARDCGCISIKAFAVAVMRAKQFYGEITDLTVVASMFDIDTLSKGHDLFGESDPHAPNLNVYKNRAIMQSLIDTDCSEDAVVMYVTKYMSSLSLDDSSLFTSARDLEDRRNDALSNSPWFEPLREEDDAKPPHMKRRWHMTLKERSEVEKFTGEARSMSSARSENGH